MTLQQLGQLLQPTASKRSKSLAGPLILTSTRRFPCGMIPGQPDQVVLEVIQRGYCRGDKVFRPARVIVNDRNHSPGPNDAR